MKRSFLVLLCVILAATMALVACDNGHDHTYSDIWSTDETNHWHKATCEHTDAVASLGAHIDADKDKVCDICNYDYGHTHTYSTTWSTDATYHWHVASCGCEYIADKGAHSDLDDDGACDVCALGSDHQHVISTYWSYDSDSHWYGTECGHGVKTEQAAHTLDKGGVCTVCQYGIDSITVEDAIKLAIENASIVNGGKVVILDDYHAGYVNSYNVVYTLGENMILYTEEDEYSTTTYWYYLVNEDTAFGVYENEQTPYLAYSTEAANVLGYAINMFGWSQTYYGAEDFVAGLYELVLENANNDAEELITILDDEVIYSFSFGYFTDALYITTVEFTLTDEYTIDTLTVTEEKYSYVVDEYSEEYTEHYGYIANEDGTFSTVWLMPEEVREITFTQTTGDRTTDTKYDPAKVLAQGFELKDMDGNTVPAEGNAASAGIENAYTVNATSPDGCIVDLNTLTYTVLLNGEEAMEYVDYYVFAWGADFAITFYSAGDYTVTVDFGMATATYEYTVTVPDATEISAVIDDEYVSEITIYLGTELVFTVEDVINMYANCEYTVSLTSSTATVVSEGGINVFTATDTGTYIILITAKGDVTATLMVTVEEAPNVEEIFSGMYDFVYWGSTLLSFEFIPSEEDYKTGTVIITTDNPYMDKSGTFTYVYDEATGIITLTDADENEYTDWLAFNNFTLEVENDGEYYPLTRPAEKLTEEFFVDKTYTDGTWYVSFTKYDDQYIVEVKDALMGRPSNAASYYYTVSEVFGVYEITVVLNEDNGILGEPPAIYVFAYFADEGTFKLVTEDYSEIEMQLYNPYM